MAEPPPAADIEVAPLSRALLDGVDDPTTGSKERVDLAVLPCFEDERPLQGLAGLVDWRMGGQLSTLLRDGFFVGASTDVVLMPGRRTLPMQRLVLVGLGPSAEFDQAAAEATGERLVELVERLGPRDVLVAMPGRVPERATVEAVFRGLTRALTRASGEPDDALAQPAARAVGDDSSGSVMVEPEPAHPVDVGTDPTRAAEDGVVPLEAAADGRSAEGSGGDRGGVVIASGAGSEAPHGSDGPVRGGAPGNDDVSARVRRWWVVADPRHEARLRRLLEGPPRAAGV